MNALNSEKKVQRLIILLQQMPSKYALEQIILPFIYNSKLLLTFDLSSRPSNYKEGRGIWYTFTFV